MKKIRDFKIMGQVDYKLWLGFPPKLISTEFRLSTKLLVEIIESNQNFDFDSQNRNSDKQSK
jgi:hypothetical protein